MAKKKSKKSKTRKRSITKKTNAFTSKKISIETQPSLSFFQKHKFNFIWLVLVALVSIFSIKALAIPEFYTSHDGETHTARLANYYLALQEGQFPPQIAPTLFGSFGFPIFIFIYPLPYLVGSFFHALGLSYTDAAEMTMALGQVLSALFMFWFFKLETKNNLTSFVASLFFTFAPYRFLMIFVRGAFAESFAYIFIASSLICLYKLVEQRNKLWVSLTAISLSGLLLSHQLVAVMFLPVLLWYLISKLIGNKNWKSILSLFSFSLFLGFGLASFIYLPAFFERDLLKFDDSISYTADHFVSPWQLVRSPWSYGFSHNGVENDDMSFQIGLTHLLVVGLSGLFLIYSFLTKKLTLKDHDYRSLFMWLFAFGLASIIMIEHPLNHLLWEYTPGLNYVDFPWRFIGVAAVSASMLSAYLLSKTKNNLFLLVTLVFLVFYANRNHLRINQTVEFDDKHFETYENTATWVNEFLPKDRITNKWESIEGQTSIITGDAQIEVTNNSATQIDLKVDAKSESEIRIHKMYLPGWQVLVDGVIHDPKNSSQVGVVGSVDVQTNTDYSSFMKVKLDPGSYQIQAIFKPTPLRQTGRLITLASLFIILGILFLPKKEVN